MSGKTFFSLGAYHKISFRKPPVWFGWLVSRPFAGGQFRLILAGFRVLAGVVVICTYAFGTFSVFCVTFFIVFKFILIASHPRREQLYPGKAGLEQEVATCLSPPFMTEIFVNSASHLH